MRLSHPFLASNASSARDRRQTLSQPASLHLVPHAHPLVPDPLLLHIDTATNAYAAAQDNYSTRADPTKCNIRSFMR